MRRILGLFLAGGLMLAATSSAEAQFYRGYRGGAYGYGVPGYYGSSYYAPTSGVVIATPGFTYSSGYAGVAPLVGGGTGRLALRLWRGSRRFALRLRLCCAPGLLLLLDVWLRLSGLWVWRYGRPLGFRRGWGRW